MKWNALPSTIQPRFREVTLLLFIASVATAGFGVMKVLSYGASALAVGWAIAAAGFAMAFTVRALIAFIYNDGDYVEMWSVLSAFMYTVFALAAFNWIGLIAAALVSAAWITGRSGHDEEERHRRVLMQQRRNALRSRKRTDQGPGEASGLLEESALDLTERSERRSAEEAFHDHPSTRRGTIERARMIDGNPWNLPPGGG